MDLDAQRRLRPSGHQNERHTARRALQRAGRAGPCQARGSRSPLRQERTMTILVSYDGPVDGQEAIDRAARLMPGAETTVLTVWEPIQLMLTRTGGMGSAWYPPDDGRADAASEEAAQAKATEGADRATA